MIASRQSQNQNPPLLEEKDSALNPINENDESIDVELQDNQSDEKGFIKSLAGRGLDLFNDEEDFNKSETRGRKKKNATNQEFSTLVIALLTLAISFSKIPKNIQPNESELTVFSNHLTGILLRHLPISQKLSADTLDIIGLIAVGSGWYARVAPELKSARELNSPKESQPIQNIKSNTDSISDPIQKLSPSLSNFLDGVEKKAILNASNNPN